MLLIEYIEKRYGKERGNKKRFLDDNPQIIAPELSRWLKSGFKINLANGEIYKPASKKVNL
ncbi:hypothetical protein D6U78_10095 [Vibrio cholerae]|nr:hypothetical protein [Vibrio cholerae]GIA99386.1 hypothetical protein VCSRO136_2325 [Vibrio cholerae]